VTIDRYIARRDATGIAFMGLLYAAAMAGEFARIFKALGFTYITLDLEGFRSGSMNAVLPVACLRTGTR